MIFLTKQEFRKFLIQNVGKRVAFFDWEPCVLNDHLHITDGDKIEPLMFATTVHCPSDDNDNEILFDYDWSLYEEDKKSMFCVLENKDICDLIQELEEAKDSSSEFNLEGIKQLNWIGDE